MRGVDWNMSQALYAHWLGIEIPGFKLCPLLADLDRMLKYFDEIGLKPGHALCPCPECGDYHRWALLGELMSNALVLRSADESKLLATVDKNLEPVRALYGGEKGLQEMRLAAANYFASVANRLRDGEIDPTSELGHPNPPIDSVPPYRMPGASRWKRTESGRFCLIEKAEPSTQSDKDEKGE